VEQARRDATPLSGWSPWRPLGLASPLSGPVLAEVLDGGQSFRWQLHPHGVWEGAWAGCRARVRPGRPPEGDLEWSAPLPQAAETESALRTYLAADADWHRKADDLPWRSDPHLARAIAAFPGLRILRQPFGETLLCFLCSAAKQIVQIKQIAAALSQPRGRLPTWEELADTPEASLRACKLGFRARYVHQTARLLARQPGWLAETAALPYPEARERLCRLPGVGEKVADCVLLFGAGRLEAFPVDVWIIAAMSRRYGLKGWKPAQIAHFGRVHFGPQAGLAQQYLFAWERAHGSGVPALPS
jgi:N-glycosylase/DNA lyase